MFIGEDMVDIITEQSNLYAFQKSLVTTNSTRDDGVIVGLIRFYTCTFYNLYYLCGFTECYKKCYFLSVAKWTLWEKMTSQCFLCILDLITLCPTVADWQQINNL